MKKEYLAQLHLHTMESSACGQSSGRDQARACIKAGYDILVVTDHFMNSNIRAHHRAGWQEKVDILMKGYEEARRESEGSGLCVLFGWETCNEGIEVLTYGLGREFLIDNPDIADISLDEYIFRTHRAGAFLAHAHPFREAYYISPFLPRPYLFDALEVYNARNADESMNERALRMAEMSGILKIAGSDAHEISQVKAGAVAFRDRIENERDLVSALRSGRFRILRSV